MPEQRSLRYRVVDVFTRSPLEGNPLAVFPDGEVLNAATMQRIARELNLSETVFIFPATHADYAARLRIFTPFQELPFAGHPTVGAAFVLLDEDRIQEPGNSFVLQEEVGPVPIRVEPGDRPLIWLSTPPIEQGPLFDGAQCAAALGIHASDLLDVPPQLLSAGNPTIFVAVKEPAIVDRTNAPELAALQRIYPEPACIFVFAPTPEGAYSRMFAPAYGIAEDPATGSSTGPLAEFMIRHNLVTPADGARFVSEQGTHMGRRSLLHVHLRGEAGREAIEVGGYVTPLVNATMRF